MDLVTVSDLQELFLQIIDIRKLLRSNQDKLRLAQQALQIMEGTANENTQEKS